MNILNLVEKLLDWCLWCPPLSLFIKFISTRYHNVPLWNGTLKHSKLCISFARCGYDQIPGASHHPLDGVLGLGKGKSSIVTQLHNQGLIRNVVGHCLSSRGGGFLFFGDDVYASSPVVWTPMSNDYT